MNLLELIIKSDIEWPALARIAVQDDGGALKWSMSSDTPVLCKSSGVWIRTGGGSDPEYGIIEMADDWSTRIITREEWQQERDKMHKRDAINYMTPVYIPPIGAPSELWFGGSFSYNCEFICVRGNNYIVWNLDADRPDCAYIMNSEFRPLRSEREKEIDEMVKAITDDRIAPLYVQNIAAKLYDAGYRKEQAK